MAILSNPYTGDDPPDTWEENNDKCEDEEDYKATVMARRSCSWSTLGVEGLSQHKDS
jgi:hypothetical protein